MPEWNGPEHPHSHSDAAQQHPRQTDSDFTQRFQTRTACARVWGGFTLETWPCLRLQAIDGHRTPLAVSCFPAMWCFFRCQSLLLFDLSGLQGAASAKGDRRSWPSNVWPRHVLNRHATLKRNHLQRTAEIEAAHICKARSSLQAILTSCLVGRREQAAFSSSGNYLNQQCLQIAWPGHHLRSSNRTVNALRHVQVHGCFPPARLVWRCRWPSEAA